MTIQTLSIAQLIGHYELEAFRDRGHVDALRKATLSKALRELGYQAALKYAKVDERVRIDLPGAPLQVYCEIRVSDSTGQDWVRRPWLAHWYTRWAQVVAIWLLKWVDRIEANSAWVAG